MTATLLLPILLPLLLAALVPFLRKNAKALGALPLVAGALALGTLVQAARTPDASLLRHWVGPFTLQFGLDGWRLLLLGFATLFGLMTGLFALTATARAPRPALFVASVLVAFGSATGVILTGNVLVLLIFWELFLLALYGSIMSGGRDAERVALKALLIGGASDFLMVLGLMAYLFLHGSPTLGTPIAVASCPTAFVAFLLVFLGAGAKAGMYPFHTWIPEAAEVMPAPAFAALPASLEKVLGISFLFTLTHEMFVLDWRARVVMVLFGLVTVFVVLVPAFVESNLKKVLALTAISPVGFMVCGMASGTAAGAVGALLYMLTHATYKSGMFFAAGALEARTGSARLEDLRGAGRALPSVGLGFALAFLAAISLPPTGGFLAKELIFEGLLHRHQAPIVALLALGALLSVAVFSKLMAVLFERTAREPIVAPVGERLPALGLGLASVLTAWAFAKAGGVFAHLVEGAHLDLSGAWHLGPLTVVSLGIWILGFMLWSEARSRVEQPALAFGGIRTSPVLGEGLRLAEEKRLDAYEVALRVADWLTRVVFLSFERLIDRVVDAIVGAGAFLARHFLSAVHDGLYANYLAWAVAGLAAVLLLVM